LTLVPTLALALAKVLAAYGFSLGVSNAEDARVDLLHRTERAFVLVQEKERSLVKTCRFFES